ncbi:hypothetical protein M0813_08663 [Anaeramoeba flamelloides]|uniref:Uncharacterized protein n=1 Tax=Anaeramoeba flamelloides TaxID=1746091 RepID=A0ABQ8X7H4_9EUKA|nr:hypothetical protein M0813_08663 [Anaeramoeba flamelloides]
MNQLEKTVSSPIPKQPNNNLAQLPIRSQSDCYFNRFSRPDLIEPQPKKNFPSQRFKNKRFFKYDFSKELSQFITPQKELIEMSFENNPYNEFEQVNFLEELVIDELILNFENKQKEQKLSRKKKDKEKEQVQEQEQVQEEVDIEEEEMYFYNFNESELELAFSPPLRSKCPLWQDNKFLKKHNFENDF